MNWSNVTFGKHKGSTIPQLVFSDPDWFFWACESGAFTGKGSLLQEAKYVYPRACAIQIPEKDGEKRLVEYTTDWPTGKFGTMSTLPESQADGLGAGSIWTGKVIDMRVPRNIAKHDKTGYKNFIFSLKAILFGDPGYKMTKRRCEEFFEDDRNFVTPGIIQFPQGKKSAGQSGKDNSMEPDYGVLRI
jgi:hypothetical protein